MNQSAKKRDWPWTFTTGINNEDYHKWLRHLPKRNYDDWMLKFVP